MPPVPLTLLRSSPASHPQWRHLGGGRRAMQLTEIFDAHGVVTQQLDAAAVPPSGRLALLRAAWQLRFTPPVIRMRADRHLIRHLASDYLRHRWYFARHPEIRVFVIENCTDYAQFRAAKDAGVAIVCLPANFEVWQTTDQRDFYSGEPMPASLHREATFTALSDAVFCISREEQWYLANYGARADYLPYYPPAADLAFLRRVRARRAATPPAGREFFTVTTASNLKNRDALIALAGMVATLPPGAGFHLHVGGREVESLRPLFPTDRCTFHGELSDAALEDLMVRCQASIVFQRSGVGALTRLPELLCAGIPVLANPHAARSCYGRPGVHLFHDAAELLALAQLDLPVPPEPQPDHAAAARLIETIRALALRPAQA